MNSICSSNDMTPNPVKIGNAVTFMKNLATVASLIFLKNFNLK